MTEEFRAEWLPDGFEDRRKEKKQGIPIIGWPLTREQFFNSQMLEKDVAVCIEVAQGISTAIGHDHITRVIKMMMAEMEEGVQMKRKTGELKAKMEEALREGEGFKGLSVKAMDEFLSTAISMRKGFVPSMKVDNGDNSVK